jgi:hypothetical protein
MLNEIKPRNFKLGFSSTNCSLKKSKVKVYYSFTLGYWYHVAFIKSIKATRYKVNKYLPTTDNCTRG